MKKPEVFYKKRIERYKKLNRKQNRLVNTISNVRLLIFIAGILVTLVVYYIGLRILSIASALSAICAFIYIVWNHIRLINNRSCTTSIVKINENSLKRLIGEWKEFEDTGEEYSDKEHEYSFDLDLFGKGSLFQMINVTQTFSGRTILKNTLVKPEKQASQIEKRQQAIEELSQKLSWRQRFTAEGMSISSEALDPQFLFDWAEKENLFYRKTWVKVAFKLFPAFTFILFSISLVTGILSFYIPLILLAVQLVVLKINSKDRGKELEAVSRYRDSIKVYDRLFKLVESKQFSSVYLVDLKEKLINENGLTASKQIYRLSKLVDSISNRYNAFYMVFDIFTLWDYQCQISLEDWKQASGVYLRRWLEVIGEIEALSSLSQLAYDNPDWVMPRLEESLVLFKARHMGHPLLGNKRICNDLVFDQDAKVLLITGSNMSGKSTLLRTAGINLVLAYAGSPVCAAEFSCSIFDIHTCMRVSDNLEKSISSFYAELIRIKAIVTAAREGRRIFFLLDEIFKGTNSADRHTGAKVLVKKLSESASIGLVSTHDLELGELEDEDKRIKNYHFREYYKGNEIFFDFKLHQGISKTRNAIYLMKMAGIDFD
ncbi:MAG: DNA mismatch repair protein MutS [Clostridia bacterium]|nr:DNA mismatch repair protein MutS [Clostridia bacterium]